MNTPSDTPPAPKKAPYSLYGKGGQRKYLTPTERKAFLEAADGADRQVRTFCALITHTGCRITEALELTADRVDLSENRIRLESLKKRRRDIWRSVPVPPEFVDTLNMVHDLRTLQKRPDRGQGVLLWPWSRVTGWTRVLEVMAAAKIQGLYATPKGLRHAFGIRAITQGVQLNVLQKWMGHAKMETTAIYADVQGPEEQKIAERMWSDD